MAAFTSKAAGPWSSSGQTTWNEAGVPGDGDTVTITHAITVDVNTVIGSGSATAMAFSAALTVAAGISLTLKGDVIHGNAPFTLNANAGLIFDCTSANRKWLMGTASNQSLCYFNIVGTLGNKGYITKIGSNFCWFDDGVNGDGTRSNTTGWDLLHYAMTGIGKSDGSMAIGLNDFGVHHIRARFGLIDGCATLFKNNPYSWDLAGNRDFRIEDNTFVNSMAGSKNVVFMGTNNGTGVVTCARNTFDKTPDFNMNQVTKDANVFRAGWTYLGRTGGLITGNLIVDPSSGALIIDANPTDNYWIAPSPYAGNPHCFNMADGLTSIGNVFENPNALAIDTGECHYYNTKSAIIRNCLAVPSVVDGYALGCMANIVNGDGEDTELTHNTIVGNAATLLFTEDTNDTGPICSVMKSNIVHASSIIAPNPARLFYDLKHGDNALNRTNMVVPSGATHNGKFNDEDFTDPNTSVVHHGYKGRFTLPTEPGANDVDADPQFYDSTRNFSSWAVHKGAALVGDSQAVKTAASLNLLQNDPSLIRTDLIPWVREGFRPTNEMYRDAGHDGVTIGAVEMAAPTGGGGTGRYATVFAGCVR